MYKVMKSFICRGCVNPVTGTGRTSVDTGGDISLTVTIVNWPYNDIKPTKPKMAVNPLCTCVLKHKENCSEPFDAVQVRLSIMTSDGIQEVVQHRYANATATLAHWSNHPPLIRLWVIALDT